MIAPWQKKLEHGLQHLGFASCFHTLEQYLLLLAKWNQAYNLTAIRNLEDMVNRHIFDSLGILPWIKGSNMIDVGTGAGLPGIPLAIVKPEIQITLLDSNGKKTRFLTEMKRILPLKNISVINDRVEAYHPTQGFDTVTSRAFSNLNTFVESTRHLIAADGQWLAMKGEQVANELLDIHHPYALHTYTLPGSKGEHYCVTIPAF